MEMMDPIIMVPVLVVLLAVVFYLGWFLNSKAGKDRILCRGQEHDDRHDGNQEHGVDQ